MDAAPQLTLYGTQFCHLCDEAKAILQLAGVEFAYIDIACNNDLLVRYGIRIPVVQKVGVATELAWPFDRQTFEQWLAL
jgi:hypothetical protein